MYHFDFYRLEEAAELEELGFEEYLPGEGVALVEWGERFPFVMPRERLLVVLERFYDHGGEGRRLWFTPYGDTAAAVVEKLIETITWKVDGTLNRVPLVFNDDPGGLGG